VSQGSNCCLGDRDVLLDGAGAGTDGSYDVSSRHDGDTAAEYDDLACIAFLDTKKRLARLRERCEFGRGLVEKSRGHGFVDRKINAADQRAILTYERHQVSTGVNNGDVVGDT